MVERIEDMPAGTIGFRGEGEISEEDFTGTIGPAIREAVGAGGVRLLLVAPPGFGSGDVKDMAKRVQKLPGLGHRNDWKRVAIIIDNGWLRRTSGMWSGLVPVETKVFAPDEEPAARQWLSEG